MRCITNEDKALVDLKVDALLDNLLNSDMSSQEVYNEMQTNVSNSEVARSDDELVTNSTEQPIISVSPTYADGTQKSQEDMQFERQARIEHERSVHNTNRVYFGNEQESRVIPPSEYNQYFSNNGVDSIDVNEFNNRQSRLSGVEKSALRREAASNKQSYASDDVTYAKGRYMDSDGKAKDYKIVAQKIDVNEMIGKSVKSPEEAIERLKQYITYCINKQYGGFQHIKTIVVSGETLIINNIAFIPCVDAKYIKDKKIFPLDSIDLIENGTIASFFNWNTLKKMTSLYSVSFDSMEFYRCEVGSSLGLGNRIGVSSLFKINGSLDVLTIGKDTITRNSLNKEDSVPMKRNLATSKRFFNFSDGYKINIYAGTNGLQNYMFSNLKNYAYNRGNKGTIRYVGGVTIRAGLAAVSGVVNFGTHLVGAVINTFKDAMTDVSQDDLYK